MLKQNQPILQIVVIVLRCYEVSTSGHFFLEGASFYSRLPGLLHFINLPLHFAELSGWIQDSFWRASGQTPKRQHPGIWIRSYAMALWVFRHKHFSVDLALWGKTDVIPSQSLTGTAPEKWPFHPIGRRIGSSFQPSILRGENVKLPRSTIILGKKPSFSSKEITTHPDIAHPFGNPPGQLWKEPHHSLLVKVARGVFQRFNGCSWFP